MQSQARDTLPEVKKECDSFDDSGSQYSADNSLDGTCHESTDVDPSEDRDDDGAQSCENASNQIVLYDPGAGDKSQALSVLDPAEHEPPLPKFVESNNSNRVLPSVGAFTVQCATCFKWRLIPTKEKYEEIREHIMEKPFVCETAREWRPDISCEDPADIYQDGSRLWAIDKPSISQPPPGWQRLLRIRGEGSTKFADVYYVAPSGKRLRSMVEIQKYLVEHPEFIQAGVNMSQFSFQIPKPLQENYVRKRQYSKAMRQYDGAALEMTRPLEPGEVNPLSWAGPNTDMQIVTRPDGLPSQCFEASVFDPVAPRAKKQMVKRPSKQMYNTCDQPKVKVEEPQQDRNVAYDLQ